MYCLSVHFSKHNIHGSWKVVVNFTEATVSLPMMATISASMWFLPMWSIRARWRKPGACRQKTLLWSVTVTGIP